MDHDPLWANRLILAIVKCQFFSYVVIRSGRDVLIASERKGKQMSDNMTLDQMVDALGKLKAKIAILTDQERDLKTKLSASGLKDIHGKLFSCSISYDIETMRFDSDKVKALLSPAQIIAVTKTTKSTRVSINPRKPASKASGE
jgi:hypothetical protein